MNLPPAVPAKTVCEPARFGQQRAFRGFRTDDTAPAAFRHLLDAPRHVDRHGQVPRPVHLAGVPQQEQQQRDIGHHPPVLIEDGHRLTGRVQDHSDVGLHSAHQSPHPLDPFRRRRACRAGLPVAVIQDVDRDHFQAECVQDAGRDLGIACASLVEHHAQPPPADTVDVAGIEEGSQVGLQQSCGEDDGAHLFRGHSTIVLTEEDVLDAAFSLRGHGDPRALREHDLRLFRVVRAHTDVHPSRRVPLLQVEAGERTGSYAQVSHGHARRVQPRSECPVEYAGDRMLISAGSDDGTSAQGRAVGHTESHHHLGSDVHVDEAAHSLFSEQ